MWRFGLDFLIVFLLVIFWQTEEIGREHHTKVFEACSEVMTLVQVSGSHTDYYILIPETIFSTL